MKQQSLRMVVEVNKLIINTLLTNGGLHLPSIGSLSVQTSTSSGGDSVIRVITLSTENQHKSLIDVITERGNCTQKQSEHIYKKWMEIVAVDGVVTIDRVGVIKEGAFEINEELQSKLNPIVTTSTSAANAKAAPKLGAKGVKHTEAKRGKREKKSLPRWIFVAAAVIVIAAIYLLIENLSQESQRTPTLVETQEVQIKEQSDSAALETKQPKSIAPKVEEKSVDTDVKIDMSATNSDVLNSYLKACEGSSTRYKVVYGAYTSSYNAGKSLKYAYTKGKGIDKLRLGAYVRGDKYLVTLYESNDYNSCQELINSNTFDSIATGVWIYDKR